MFNVKSRDVFIPAPEPGVAATAASFRASAGEDLLSIHGYISRSDTLNEGYIRYSNDNGRSWSQPHAWATKFDHPDGTGRRHFRSGCFDDRTGRYIQFWTEGVLPTDEPLEGMSHWTVHYFTSTDGGRTQLVNEQIVHEGESYDSVHHFPGVTRGVNCIMQGDLGSEPLIRSDGAILLAVQTSRMDEKGKLYQPYPHMTFLDSMMLIGRWTPDGRLAWRNGDRIGVDVSRSTRGLFEPTLVELDGGRLLVVMRGSNAKNEDLPGYKWYAISDDGGETWSAAEPWIFDDGEPFYSPSSCSQLIAHSNGTVYWVGNICNENPWGNLPRFPLFLGEVDKRTGLLIRKSLVTIDDKAEDESAYLTLSNFYLREERETGDFLMHMTRFFAHDQRIDGVIDWSADALQYRIAVQ